MGIPSSMPYFFVFIKTESGEVILKDTNERQIFFILLSGHKIAICLNQYTRQFTFKGKADIVNNLASP